MELKLERLLQNHHVHAMTEQRPKQALSDAHATTDAGDAHEDEGLHAHPLQRHRHQLLAATARTRRHHRVHDLLADPRRGRRQHPADERQDHKEEREGPARLPDQTHGGAGVAEDLREPSQPSPLGLLPMMRDHAGSVDKDASGLHP